MVVLFIVLARGRLSCNEKQGLATLMPILSAEPALFPERLFDDDVAGDVNGRRWCVIHTRPRQEKSLARQLHDNDVPFYLPLVTKRLRIRGKVVESFHPLFTGYVFLLGNAEDQVYAQSTRRTAGFLDVRDQAGLWKDLRQIQRLIASGSPINPENQLTPGTPVEIQSGPLAGLRGMIVKSASGHRFVVKVDFIQRGASVLLDEWVLARTMP